MAARPRQAGERSPRSWRSMASPAVMEHGQSRGDGAWPVPRWWMASPAVMEHGQSCGDGAWLVLGSGGRAPPGLVGPRRGPIGRGEWRSRMRLPTWWQPTWPRRSTGRAP